MYSTQPVGTGFKEETESKMTLTNSFHQLKQSSKILQDDDFFEEDEGNNNKINRFGRQVDA